MRLEKILESYGLSNKEAHIYLACLQIGSGTAYAISKRAKIPRATTYEILESLKKKGLISTFNKKGIKTFTVDDPKKLIEISKAKLITIQKALPDLQALYGSNKSYPRVRFYEGKEGMQIILNEILNEAKELLSFASATDLLDFFKDEWPEFVTKRVAKKIPVKVITRDSPTAQQRKQSGHTELRMVKIASSQYMFQSNIFIWANKIAMFSFHKDITALVIESEEMATTQRAMFTIVWDTLP